MTLTKNYIIPLIVVFALLMVLLNFTFKDYSNIEDLAGILVQSIITILVLLVGALFVIVQFAAQRYSPRNLARLILRFPESMFIIFTYFLITLFGILLLGNTSVLKTGVGTIPLGDTVALKSGAVLIYDAFISLCVTLVVLSFIFMYRLTSLIRPDSIASKLSGQVKKKGGIFISALGKHYRSDPVRYPLNIPPNDDVLVPLFNILEGSMTSHDLATINIVLTEIEDVIRHSYSNLNMTEDESVALTQYLGMHLTRITEMVPDVHEDDIYQPIFKIQNLLVTESSKQGFFEAYKWVMITYYYILRFVSRQQEESDYPIRSAIHYASNLVDVKQIYSEELLPAFLDLLNYLSSIVDTSGERQFKEPMEASLMGMASKSEGVLSLHKQVCARIAQLGKTTLAKIYLQKLLERLVFFEGFVLGAQLEALTEEVLRGQEMESRNTIFRESAAAVIAQYQDHSKVLKGLQDILKKTNISVDLAK